MRSPYADDRKHSVLEVLEHALAQLIADDTEQGFAVFLIGMERSRALSDVMGYSFGEEVVSLGGERIESTLREQDSAVRLSNDEFVVVIKSVASTEESLIVAKRLIAQLQRPCAARGQVVNV